MSQEEIMSDGRVEALAEDHQAVTVAVCPMLQAVQAKLLYPVQGYCILGPSPGCFMIPSIAEFREFCSGPGFTACPLFRSAQDNLSAKQDRDGLRSLHPSPW